MSRPRVSVIVAAKDEEENIQRCLRAVNEQEADFEFEVLVVDSGSKDRTAEIARNLGARVLSIPAGSFQHGRTRQTASEEARGDYLVYLVADAVPADEQWLASLVHAVASDPEVAGAYSRQLPRQGAGPLEEYRLRHRRSWSTERQERRTRKGEDFWALSPEERFSMCEFDDVSCCRRGSLLREFPIPEVDWAEDLLWAKSVLLAGYKIVLEPGSLVLHSHPETVRYALRRGYMDQDTVKKSFGVLYFDKKRAVLTGFPRLFLEQARVMFSREKSLYRSLKDIIWNAARLGCEVSGNFLASCETRRYHLVHDFISGLRTRDVVAQRKGQVLETRFTLGNDVRRVLFMNPDAAVQRSVAVPPGAKLVFGAGLNPKARPMRKAPVLFAAAVDNEPVWSREIGPGGTGQEPAWVEASVDLAAWAGRTARISLVTRAKDTDYAWAGWAEPRVVVDELSLVDRGVNAILEEVDRRMRGTPLRHP